MRAPSPPRASRPPSPARIALSASASEASLFRPKALPNAFQGHVPLHAPPLRPPSPDPADRAAPPPALIRKVCQVAKSIREERSQGELLPTLKLFAGSQVEALLGMVSTNTSDLERASQRVPPGGRGTYLVLPEVTSMPDLNPCPSINDFRGGRGLQSAPSELFGGGEECRARGGGSRGGEYPPRAHTALGFSRHRPYVLEVDEDEWASDDDDVLNESEELLTAHPPPSAPSRSRAASRVPGAGGGARPATSLGFAPPGGDEQAGRGERKRRKRPPSENDLLAVQAGKGIAKELEAKLNNYRYNSQQRALLQQRVEQYNQELKERRQQQYNGRNLVTENKHSVGKLSPEMSAKVLQDRVRREQEKWTAVMERAKERKRREEEAKDAWAMKDTYLQEKAEATRAAQARAEQFQQQRRRWWAMLAALTSRFLLFETVIKDERERRRVVEMREKAAITIQRWIRRVLNDLHQRLEINMAICIQRVVRKRLFASRAERCARAADLILTYLQDLKRTQALLLAFRVCRQRVLYLQRAIHTRALRVRAQKAMVMMQWARAEEDWARAREEARRAAKKKDKKDTKAPKDKKKDKVEKGGGGGAPEKKSAAPAAAEKSNPPSPEQSAKKLTKVVAGAKAAHEKARQKFSTKEPLVGEEYAAVMTVSDEIKKAVVEKHLVAKRRFHMEALARWAEEHSKVDEAKQTALALNKARMLVQGIKDPSPLEVQKQPPRLRVLATRTEMRKLMLAGLAETLAQREKESAQPRFGRPTSALKSAAADVARPRSGRKSTAKSRPSTSKRESESAEKGGGKRTSQGPRAVGEGDVSRGGKGGGEGVGGVREIKEEPSASSGESEGDNKEHEAGAVTKERRVTQQEQAPGGRRVSGALRAEQAGGVAWPSIGDVEGARRMSESLERRMSESVERGPLQGVRSKEGLRGL